ncbi:MAG: TonB-dependent receptor [Labilithrix sp.]|nr:TonB-dependent receptor [Labilithrix sp.]
MVVRTLASLGLTCAMLVAAVPARAHDVVPPKPKTQPAPEWPDGKRDAHDVVVPVIVTVSEDGSVSAAEVEASVGPDFDAAALRAVRAWTFTPATRDDKPVSARIRSVVRFVGVSAPAGPAAALQEAPASPAPVAPAIGAAGATTPSPAPKVDTVRVTGNAPPRSASEVVRGREIVTAAPHRTASDVLNVVPGVFVTQHSGEGKAHQIFLRGFDAVHGQDVELWVGGIPINEVSNVHGQGYADLHFVMPEIIRDVTAMPGTFDPKQGDFAVAGSVRMRLAYPEPGGTIKGSLGSFGGRRLFLAYHPKDSSEETFAAFESYSTDGFGPNRAARRGSLIAQATHDFSDGLALRVLGSTYAGRFDSAGVVSAQDVESGRIDRFAVYDPKQGGYSTRHQLLLELHKDGESSRWSVAPFVALRTLHLRQNFTGYFLDTQRSGRTRLDSDNTQQINESVTAGMTASYKKAVSWLSSRDSVEIGVYGRHDVIEQSQRRLSDVNDQPTETLVDADVRGTNVAGWVDVAVHPIQRLAVRGGLRTDVLAYAAQDRVLATGEAVPAQGRAAQGAHLGKKATVDLSLVPRVHLLASYGDGFRSPQARSLSQGERTFFTEVSSWEIGARYNDGRALAGSIAGFYTRLSDDLAFDPATARNERVPGTERKGIAAEITARAGEMLVLSSSATYTHASFTASNEQYGKGDLLPYVPQLVVRSDAAIKHKLARVLGRDLEGRLGAGIEGLAGRPLPFKDVGRNVFLVDTSAGLRLKEVELGIDVFNLFDADWYDGQFTYASNFSRAQSPTRIPFRHVTIGPPRTVFATLTLYI